MGSMVKAIPARRRGVSLLPAGEAFLGHARRILTEVEAARTAVRGA